MTTSSIEHALRRHVSVLCDEIGSRSGAEPESLERARNYIAQTLREMGYGVTLQSYDYASPVHAASLTAANVIARATGPERAPKREFGERPDILIGAHYDTVAGTVGADDNTSAVAVLLETAHLLKDENRPLRFAAFTLEEAPYFFTSKQGSRQYVRRFGKEIAAALVLEMVGYTCAHQDYPMPLRWAGYPKTGDFIGVIGDGRSRRLVCDVARAFKSIGDLPTESLWVPLGGWLLPAVRLSDHASFWDRGVPAVMITDTAFMRNPNYHLASDRPETLDFGFMAKVVRATAAAARALTDGIGDGKGAGQEGAHGG